MFFTKKQSKALPSLLGTKKKTLSQRKTTTIKSLKKESNTPLISSAKDKSNEIIKKFHKLYAQLTGKHHEYETNTDLHVDDRFYEKFILFDGLNAYFSFFSIIFGVANYEFEYGSKVNQFTIYLYFCTLFSVFLWLNLVLYEFTIINYEKKKKTNFKR